MDFRSRYKELLIGTEDADLKDIIEYLYEELPYLWTREYKSNSNRATDICRISIGAFEYIFDDSATLEANEILGIADKVEPRLVAAFGQSVQLGKKRDDYRLRGWLGPTNSFLGEMWDKGHYIAHCIGGAVDHAELNVFRHRRDLNRGWSNEGRTFRKMEDYCFNNPGTFCFHRPIYLDNSMFPTTLEYGVLTKEKQLWVERFNNSV